MHLLPQYCVLRPALAGLRLRYKPLCGLVLGQKMPFLEHTLVELKK
jgi:hypothetical protein